MKIWKIFLLPFVVFVTGACVLVVEVVATRVLATYYGNTIFSVSSVLSVILAGLSVGYYWGGKMADGKKASFAEFFRVIMWSGVGLILSWLLMTRFLPEFAVYFSIVAGPLIFVTILYFLPTVGLGILSPYAIKLQKILTPKDGVGSISGKMYFWSTLGSICGSLVTGFYLVPSFGVSEIVLAVAVVVLVLGMVPVILLSGIRAIPVPVLLVVLSVMVRGETHKERGLVMEKEGIYTNMKVIEIIHDGKPALLFKQDRDLSAVISVENGRSLLNYADYYSIYENFGVEVKRALVLGAGAYSIPKMLLEDLPGAVIDVVDIEPFLYDVAKEYFGLFESDRIKNYVMDGRSFLRNSDEKYDLIFSDAYRYSVPAHLTTVEFFRLVKDRLTDNGIFLANVIGNLSENKVGFALSEAKTLMSVFPNSYFFATGGGSGSARNIVFVGGKNLGGMRDARLTLDRMRKENVILGDLGKQIVFEDNYAPVDYFMAKEEWEERWGN